MDLVAHVPYLTLIGVLILALLVLSLYLLCSSPRRNRRSVHVQTYYTCMPKPVSAAQREEHGLQSMAINKGRRWQEEERYSEEPTLTSTHNQPNDPPTTDVTSANRAADAGSTHGQKVKGRAPAVPPAGEHQYENASAWTAYANAGDHAPYRVSRIEQLDATRSYGDDDVVSAAFTNDSFDTYSDEYVNTQALQQRTEQP